MGRAVGRTLALLAVLVALAAVGYRWTLDSFGAPGPSPAAATVVLPKGAGLKAIAAQLAVAGVIEQPMLFIAGVRLHRSQARLRAGEYQFPPRVSGFEIMAMLVEGRTVVRRLTVPEGLTSREIMAIVAAADGLTGEVGEAPPEGSLLPETYHFALGDERAGLIGRMRAAMADKLAAIWAARDATVALPGPEAALVLASIVEKETGVAAERARIAGVFLNRLRQGMPLQSDPTVAYALTQGAGPLGRALTRADLEVASPYNTYQVRGLPPGPIANPGADALMAVAHPLVTDELYFVADGTGGHAFATTLAEHNRNVARWRKLQEAADP